MNPTPPANRRYRTLDAWRALAALAVVAFHCTNTMLTPEMGQWARVVLAGWAGVFVFFPISGYCILAALSRAGQATPSHFLRRRWRRIMPPYWASVALVVIAACAAAPFNAGRIGYLNIGWERWLSVLSLTQVWVGAPQILNPVYWTLCYEEQFYVVMALTLLVAGRRRLDVLLAVTVLAAVYCLPFWPERLRWPGLFLGYWLSFASGLAVYIWLHLPHDRWRAVVVFACIAITLSQTFDLGLTISAAMAVVFIALAPYDEALANTRIGAALIGVGLFSYSLYLVHVPIAGRVVNGLRRLPLPFPVPPAIAIGAGVAAGWTFYALVERRFLNTDPPVAELPLAAAS